MTYRVDELAGRAGVSVDTIRFYQARGLLDPPERQGRVAHYSEDHAERLQRIRELKEKGLTLATIKLVLAGDLDPPDQALVAAVSGRAPGEETAEAGQTYTLDEFAERVGVPPALLLAVEREGLFAPTNAGEGPGYTEADLAAARAGMSILEAGMPLAELLALARDYDRTARQTAERAVELFDRYVREPILAAASSDAEAAERLVGAFRRLLPATTVLVGHHFQRVLLAAARKRIAQLGTDEQPDPAESGRPAETA
ncbi:MAG TPA: MerR family transcriptional regulator [Actinomycetota bacterium]|jgi:DNA-binding transcriptional MerR regulator